MSENFSRRSLLLSLSATALAATLPISTAQAGSEGAYECLPAMPQDDGFADLVKSTPIIDVHCHIFNATDIPAYQFLERVVSLKFVFDDYLEKKKLNSIYQLENGEWNTFYAKSQGWFDKKLNQLRNHEAFLTPTIGVSTFPSDRLLLTPGFAQELALLETMTKPEDRTLKNIELRLMKAVKAQASKDDSDYLRYWMRYASRDWRSLNKVTTDDLEAAALRMKKQNGRLRSPIDLVDNALRFMTSMCQTRTENFLHLRQAYNIYGATKGGAVRLFTPALIDFDYWLDGPQAPRGPKSKAMPQSLIEGKGAAITRFGPYVPSVRRPRTTLREQMILMGRIALAFPGECHAYFGFCPWRQVDTKSRPTAPLKLLKTAIDQHGFIGVKLYPPMGFRPRNNKDVEDAKSIKHHMFPEHLYQPGRFKYLEKRPGQSDASWRIAMSKKFGTMLDEALEELYDFCTARKVPIITHAAPSNFSGGYDYEDPETKKLKHNFFSEKAAIIYWQKLIEQPQFNALRVNFAHAGFDNKPWTKQLIAALKNTENTFADLSYFEAILSGESKAAPCESANDLADALKTIFDDNQGLWKRFMYGSDWYMMTQENHSENYLDVFAKQIYERVASAPARDAIFQAVMVGNAARYLGLHVKDADSNYTRLADFYDTQFGKGSDTSLKARGSLDRFADLAMASQ